MKQILLKILLLGEIIWEALLKLQRYFLCKYLQTTCRDVSRFKLHIIYAECAGKIITTIVQQFYDRFEFPSTKSLHVWLDLCNISGSIVYIIFKNAFQCGHAKIDLDNSYELFTGEKLLFNNITPVDLPIVAIKI